MNILQINSVCKIGSTGRIATDIYNILLEEGNEGCIAYGRECAKDFSNTIKIGSKLDQYIHVGLTRIFDRHGFGSKEPTHKLIKEIERINPDVIHLHNIHGYYINIEILFNYLKKNKKLVIWTLHDCWAFTGHCAHFDYIGCDKWKKECYDCPQKLEYPSSKFFDNSKNNYNKKKEIFTGVENLIIVTPSEWLANLVKDSFLGEYTINVINNGIDLEVFKPTKSDFRDRYELKNKFIILGVVSDWRERKGYEYFLNLSKELKDDEVILMVGLTKKQIENIPNNIIGISRTNSVKELAEIYSASDVFINLTLEENFPTTNIEALACGTPVVTFNTGGSVESVDEKTGFIVEKGNIVELLNKIRKVKEVGKKMYSRACSEKANKLYNKNERFEEYLKLYDIREGVYDKIATK